MRRAKSGSIRSGVRTVLAAVALGAALAACDEGPVGAEGTCVAAVNIEGVTFTSSGAPAPPSNAVASTPYLTITRNTGCLDQGQPADPLAHGESNFLEVGTTLHTVEGYDATERLVYWSDVVDEWLVLEPI